ncbi:hypothetical protein Ddc_13010 [Ditylenchus destructor]|nr:hypothetical protein Ddc_13010 [Ditylenchus destructor]
MSEKFVDKYLANYQPLNYTPLSQERLRDLPLYSPLYFNVTVYDRQFNLRLVKQNVTSSSLFDTDPRMFNSNTSLNFFYGKVSNDIIPSGSEVLGTFVNGIFYGTVALCNTTRYFFLIVDRDMPPTADTVPFHSVAYRQITDIKPDRPDFSNCDCSHRDCYCQSPIRMEDQIIYTQCLPDGQLDSIY